MNSMAVDSINKSPLNKSTFKMSLIRIKKIQEITIARKNRFSQIYFLLYKKNSITVIFFVTLKWTIKCLFRYIKIIHYTFIVTLYILKARNKT